jgi:protein O-mannosyl-transferase
MTRNDPAAPQRTRTGFWPRGPLRDQACRAGLLFAATLLAYAPTLTSGFIWNDSDYVTKPALQSLSGLWKIWFVVGSTEQYYPLLHSAFWVEHRLWGDIASGYHLANVLLHATGAWLLVLVLRVLLPSGSADSIQVSAFDGAQARGFRSQPSFFDVPFLAGLLFALHPVCVESVAWISEQKNTLSIVFYLSAALVYLRWRLAPEGSISGFRFQVPAFSLFVLSCLTKTVTATLPGALLVALWWRNGRLSWRRDVLPLVPWFAVGAASGLFTAWVERKYVGAQGVEFGMNFLQRALVAGHGVWFYLGKLAWPTQLIFIYPRWTVSLSDTAQVLYPAGVVLLAACLLALSRRNRGPLAAYLFFLGSLFPVCGFFNLYAFIYSYVADHWQYLPAVGVLTLAAAGWGAVSNRWVGRRPFVRDAVPALVLVVLGVLTFRQSGMYNDMETFYRRTISANPGCWMARTNLALELSATGRADEAIASFRQALALNPASPEVIHNDLGGVLLDSGRAGEAEAEFRKALEINPGYDRARFNLGSTYLREGRLREAVSELGADLKLDPTNPTAHNNLGTAFARLGDAAAAEAQFRESVALNPAYVQAHFNLGLVCEQQGRPDEAKSEYETVLRLKPGFPAAAARLRRLEMSGGLRP